jgi:hypothetical protein
MILQYCNIILQNAIAYYNKHTSILQMIHTHIAEKLCISVVYCGFNIILSNVYIYIVVCTPLYWNMLNRVLGSVGNIHRDIPQNIIAHYKPSTESL